MRWLASLSALGPLALVACGFDSTGLPPGHVLRDDTTADFQTSGASLDDAEIADPGLISPVAYVTGAALVKGANSELFQDPSTVDWNTLDATTPARIALAVPLGNAGDKAPSGVGITQGDNWTVWLAGELWLEAGKHTFDLTADDNGLLDLAPAPGAPYQRVVRAQWFEGDQAGSFTAPADGWYPVRIAWSEGAGMAQYTLRHQPPGGTLAPIDPDRFRVAAGAQRGLIADAFDDFWMMRPAGRSLFASPMLEQDFGSAVPTDTGITSPATYSIHWGGQIRIDTAGDYAFVMDSSGGHRLWIDDALALDFLSGHAELHTSAPVHLEPGWHDVATEFTSNSGAAHAKLHVASGPDLAGGPFPLERVRPVIPRAARVAGTSQEDDLSFAAGGSAFYSLTPPIPAGASVVGVDVEYHVNDPHLRDLEISLLGPDGTSVILRAQGGPDRAGDSTEIKSTHMFDGKAAAGAWQVVITDRGGVNAGTAKDAAITIHYVGGRPPIATTAAYDSAVRDLGTPSRIDDVTYSATTPAGTAVAVRLRTGASPEDLMAQPWSEPAASGSPAIVPAGQFVQYRVELSSDGDHSPTFDWIQLVYRQAQ